MDAPESFPIERASALFRDFRYPDAAFLEHFHLLPYPESVPSNKHDIIKESSMWEILRSFRGAGLSTRRLSGL